MLDFFASKKQHKRYVVILFYLRHGAKLVHVLVYFHFINRSHAIVNIITVIFVIKCGFRNIDTIISHWQVYQLRKISSK